jgi:hypothetical protein
MIPTLWFDEAATVILQRRISAWFETHGRPKRAVVGTNAGTMEVTNNRRNPSQVLDNSIKVTQRHPRSWNAQTCRGCLSHCYEICCFKLRRVLNCFLPRAVSEHAHDTVHVSAHHLDRIEVALHSVHQSSHRPSIFPHRSTESLSCPLEAAVLGWQILKGLVLLSRYCTRLHLWHKYETSSYASYQVTFLRYS